MVVMMLGYCLHGLCTLPNMVINAKIMRKLGKNQEKKERHDVYLSLHGLCSSPNMVINVNIVRKSGKIRKN